MKLQQPQRKWQILLLAGVLASLIPVAALAMPEGKHEHCDRPDAGHRKHHDQAGPEVGVTPPHFLRGLDLTEKQGDEIFSILHSRAPVTRSNFKAVQKAQQDLKAMSRTGQYSEAKARELADALAKATGALAFQRVQDEQRIIALLTPEQRKQLEKNDDEPEFRPMRGVRALSAKPTRTM